MRKPLRKERVLILSADGTAVGGVTRVTLSLTGRLQAQGRDIQTIYPASIDEGLLQQWAARVGAKVTRNSQWLSPSAGRMRDTWALIQTIRQVSPDVVNLHYGGSHIPLKDVLAVRAAGVKHCIVALHAPISWGEAGTQRKLMTRAASWLCTVVVPCCNAVREVLVEAGVAPPKLVVIPGGVAAPESVPSRRASRAALGITESAFVVGAVTRMSPEKGMRILVQALGRFPSGTVHLLIKGDQGPELPAVKELAEQLLPGQYTILDVNADNESVFAATDVFALPSLLEGFPLVLMEAAFRGLPTVATKVGSVEDLVADGETGLLVEPNSAEALGNAIERFFNDRGLGVAMAQAAKLRAARDFTAELMVKRYEFLFRT